MIGAFAEHGGRLASAKVLWPDAPRPWLDLSTGISPWSYPVPPLASEIFARLPEPDAMNVLCAAARETYRVSPTEAMLPFAGTEMAINLLARSVAPVCRVGILGWTYSGHERAWRAAGHDVRSVPALRNEIGADVVILVNPNNPDGRAIEPSEIRSVAGANPRCLFIIDEAFADVRPEISLLNGTPLLENVVVLRSVGKFYGLAGVRLGFAITRHAVRNDLMDALGAWPVAGPAIYIGTLALRDAAWAAANRARLTAAAARLDTLLTAAGLPIAGGTTLFRLVKASSAIEVFATFGRAGILTRPFTGKPYLRFGLPADEAQFKRLEQALANL